MNRANPDARTVGRSEIVLMTGDITKVPADVTRDADLGRPIPQRCPAPGSVSSPSSTRSLSTSASNLTSR